MGQVRHGQGAIHLVESVADVAGLRVGSPDRLAYVTQTTLSVDDAAAIVAALKARFPAIIGPKKDDICYATQNRQDAVRQLARQVDLVIVVGSKNSSNSNRLREVAANLGVPAKLIDDGGDIDPTWLDEVKAIGVTAGASAPEVLVAEVVDRLRALGATTITRSAGAEESVYFPLPRELL
jgi:4-hydroxy-3-methylbut-2-enyl diphosphate reductase